MAKKITIDGLALMIGKGFTGTDKKFGAMDKKMDAGFKAINERLDKFQSDRIEKLEERMHRIEEALIIK